MLVRLVKMHFHPEFIKEFQQLFKAVQPRISAFEGCHSVQLLQDHDDPSVFFTISHWQDEQHLNAYRNSELFRTTWAQVKPNFRIKAEAWSLLGK
ncbi:putative quinol monooxygenase [Pedobacter africanus]|uniref:Quinol monooxygenase YgiN n=1 Tax=Pedobacter africanus TaxID=151894 RepID=A0ACC6KTB5_9SPHI|nr:antibiotic biosynthesis monooxygenase family protein [Pedobacter africanus]MDR6782574.1 quinol monooxygenase YgiN [Pedobacter africanus]